MLRRVSGDTLQYVKPRFENHVYYDYYNYDKKRKETEHINSVSQNSAGGVYVTTKLYGIEGHSYSLDIYYNGKHFESDTQKMEANLIITDLKVTKVDLGEKGETFAPCISFINPPGENYIYFLSFHGRILTLRSRNLMLCLVRVHIGDIPF